MAKSESTIRLNVLIVGAGLGGLSAAISIALSGSSVLVIEAAKELAEIGAGLQITPNASRLLQEWCLPESFWKSAAEPTSLAVHRYSDGKILALEKDFNKKIRAMYGAPFIDSHRVDLQRALYGRAIELGVRFKLGERVKTVDFDHPAVTTELGNTYTGDLIVGADGLWSRCRETFLGVKDPPKPTGDLAYRVVLCSDDITDLELKSWVENPSVHFWIGPGAHAVGYSLRAGKMYNIVLLVPDDLPPGVARQLGSVEEMKALFANWDPILNRFLGMVQNVEKWKLMHRPEMGSWTNKESTFVLLGDACHPMLPYLAQGANSSIEDGAVLGLLLGKIQNKQQLREALNTYEVMRKKRGEAIVRETFKQRDDFHMLDGPKQEARDALFLSQLGGHIEGPFPSRWTCPEVQPWLYGYDAKLEVETAFKNAPFAAVSGADEVKDPTLETEHMTLKYFISKLKYFVSSWY